MGTCTLITCVMIMWLMMLLFYFLWVYCGLWVLHIAHDMTTSIRGSAGHDNADYVGQMHMISVHGCDIDGFVVPDGGAPDYNAV